MDGKIFVIFVGGFLVSVMYKYTFEYIFLWKFKKYIDSNRSSEKEKILYNRLKIILHFLFYVIYALLAIFFFDFSTFIIIILPICWVFTGVIRLIRESYRYNNMKLTEEQEIKEYKDTRMTFIILFFVALFVVISGVVDFKSVAELFSQVKDYC